MKQTETIKPFSSIGKPAKFNVDKARIYKDGLTASIINMSPSYNRNLLINERNQISKQIYYYEENKTIYNL